MCGLLDQAVWCRAGWFQIFYGFKFIFELINFIIIKLEISIVITYRHTRALRVTEFSKQIGLY